MDVGKYKRKGNTAEDGYILYNLPLGDCIPMMPPLEKLTIS